MRFLVDAQLPPSLARWLREVGHEADHVEDIGLRIGNTTNHALRAWIEPRLPGIVGLLAQGSRLVEVV